MNINNINSRFDKKDSNVTKITSVQIQVKFAELKLPKNSKKLKERKISKC